MRTRFLPVWFLAVALIGVGWWQGNHQAAHAATYYVTNKIDDGSAGTLRYAISQATDGDEVHIVTPGPIVLTGGQLNINKSISIKGPEIAVSPTADPLTQLPEITGQVAIQGVSPNGSVFKIASGKSVAMSHLFITGGTIAGTTRPAGNGDDAFGGGINNAGNLTLNYCTVANNAVYGGNGPDGGGIAHGGGVYSSGKLVLNFSTVKDNLAQGGTGANAGGSQNAAYGGGIYSTGEAYINSSTISNNSAFGGGNASTPPVVATTNGGAAYGGGVAQDSSGKLNISNSTIYGNFATSGTGSVDDGDASGGGVYVKNALFNPSQSTFTANQVTGDLTLGAGVYYDATDVLHVKNSIIAENGGVVADNLSANPSFTAHSSPGINVPVGFDGGGLANNGGPTLTVKSTDLANVVDEGDNTLEVDLGDGNLVSLSFDQRGDYDRKTGPRVDAGAVESASATPVHSGATPLPSFDAGFKFHVLNGATYFTAADFNSSLTYPDPDASLKSIIITQIPPSSQGYFQLNGQTLVEGSVISVEDLDKLTYVSNDGSDSAELYWKASDGSTVSGEFTSQTPRWQAPSSGYVGGSNGTGLNKPSLYLLTPVHVSGTTYTIDAIVQSSADDGSGNYQLAISVIGSRVVSATPHLFNDTNPINGISTITLTADPSTTNNYVVVSATDINGNTTTQSLVFSTNAAGDIDGVPFRDYGGNNGDGLTRPKLSVSGIGSLNGIHANGDVPIFISVSSGATLNNAAKVQVAVSGSGANPQNREFTGTGSASGSYTLMLNVSSGTHVVSVQATDILGGTTTYQFYYKGDARPEIDESAINTAQHIPFGSTYIQNFTANDADFYVPDTSISPEPLRFQVDQEGYALSESDPIDYNLKRGNIGSFGASNYTGNAGGTTLTTNYNLQTGIGETISKPGVYALRLSLTDYWGLGKTFVYTIIVDPPAAPIWTGPGTIVAQYHDSSFSLNLNDYVTGVYDGATPTYSVISGLPSWADFSPTSGIISGTPDALASSQVKVAMNDGLGNVVQNTFTIEVVNGGPIVTAPTEGETINATVGETLDIPVAAHDPNEDSPITYALTGWAAASITTIDDNNAKITTAALTLSDVGSHPVTLTVSDGTNDTEVHFTIVVTNGYAPVIDDSSIESTYNIQAGSNFTLPISATDADATDTLSFSATEGDVSPSSSPSTAGTPVNATYTLNSVSAGTHNITLTVTDANGNSDTVSFKIIAGTGAAPTLALNASGPFNAVTGVPISVIIATATDADNPEDLTFTLSGAPSGMTLSSPSSFTGVTGSGDPKSVTLQWTPTSSQTGSYTFDVIVTDSQGFEDSVSVTINVTGSTVNHPPAVVNPITVNAFTNVPFNLQIQATDPDGDTIVSYVASNLPPGLSIIQSTGLIFGTPTAAGTYNSVTVEVTDDSTLGPETTTIEFTINVSDVNPPVLKRDGQYAFNSPYIVAPNASFIKQLQAHDDDYPENLTFSATYTDDNGVTNVPLTGVWSVFNQSGNVSAGTTASVTFTWNNVPAGVHVVTVTVEDGGGNSDSETFTVQAGNAPQLTVTPTESIFVMVGNSLPPVTLSALDGDDNEKLSFSLEGAPAGVTLSSPSSFDPVSANTATDPVSVLWTPTAGQVGAHTFDVVVTDKNGLRATQPVTVIVMVASIPSLSPVAGPIELHVGDEFTNTFTAQDSDAGDTLTFNAQTSKFDSTIPDWLPYSATPLINQTYENGPPTTASGLLVWEATEVGNYRVDVTVTDSQGHQTVQSFYINVLNGIPEIEPIANQTVSVGGAVNIPVVALDPDGDTLTYQLIGNPSWLHIDSTTGVITSDPLTASHVGTYPVTVSVNDGVNPAVTTSFTLTINDEGVPVLSSLEGPITLRVDETFTHLFTATDSDASDTLTFSVDPDGSGNVTSGFVSQSYNAGPPTTATSQLSWSASAVGNYEVIVRVEDSQSHTSTRTFFINVIEDVPAPTISNPGTWFASVGGFSTLSVQPANSAADTTNWQWTSSSLPTWVTLDGDTGVLSGTPGAGDVGITSVTVSVNDGVNPPVSVTFNIDVSNRGVPTLSSTPTSLGSPEVSLNGEGYSRMFISQDTDYPENLIYSVKVTDVGGTVLIDDISTNPGSSIQRIYQSGSLDQGGTTAGAKFDWTPATSGIYQVEISVEDLQGHVTSLTYTILVASPPQIEVNGTTTTVTINATPELPMDIPVVVSDLDDHEILSVSLDFNAPFGMTVKSPNTFSNVSSGVEKTTGLLFTPTVFQANTSYTFDVTVTDSAGLTATQTVILNVGAVNERPVISSPASGSTINLVDGHNVHLPVIATDAEGDPLTYSAIDLPIGLSIDSATGVISGLLADSGAHPVTVNVDDGKHVAPASSVTFTIVIGDTNTSPTLEPITDQMLILGQALNVQAVGSDPDHDVLKYEISGHPSWVTIDEDTGLITIPDTSLETEGSWNITVTVDDTYGGTASQSFILAVSGPFAVTTSSGDGYVTITYHVTNTTDSTISPIVRGNLTGGGYTRNEDAFFNASQGFVDDQWASPILQRKLDPTKNTRILTWTVGELAPGASATLTISVPIKGSTPHGTELTNTWSVDFGTTNYTVAPVTHP